MKRIGIKELILESTYVEGKVSPYAIAKRYELNRNSVRRTFYRLKEEGYLVRVGWADYALTESTYKRMRIEDDNK